MLETKDSDLYIAIMPIFKYLRYHRIVGQTKMTDIIYFVSYWFLYILFGFDIFSFIEYLIVLILCMGIPEEKRRQT